MGRFSAETVKTVSAPTTGNVSVETVITVSTRHCVKFLAMMVIMLNSFALQAKVIPVTDKNVQEGRSPYNWVIREGYISSSVNGASLTVGFSGTSTVSLLVETGHMIFESPDRFPILAWTVNGGPVQTHQLVAGEKSIALSGDVANPVIDLYIKGMSPFEDRYTGDLPANSVIIAGFTVDEDGSTVTGKLHRKLWLTIGDSILSGDAAALDENQGRPEDDLWAASDDARASYGYLLARHFGYREARLAFGGYDWGGGMANVPALRILTDSLTSTTSRLERGKLKPVPDVVLINLGENGAPAEHDVISALEEIRSRVNRDTKIIVMVPASGRARSELTIAFGNYKSLTGDTHAFLIDLGPVKFATADGQHPTAAGHESIYKSAVPYIDAIMTDKYLSPEKISLWEGKAPLGDGNFSDENPYITVHHPFKPNGSMVIICPGGGYGGLVTGPEGHGIAKWLNENGITGVVLEYRLPKGRQAVPLLDAGQAIRIARARAEDWGCDPDKIGIIGFSAGGHLASTAATHFDSGDGKSKNPVSRMNSRPDFAILIYPVITMGELTHQGSRRNLLGPDPSAETILYYSNEKQVSDHTPPTYLAHAQDDDGVVPENSRLFYDALQIHHIPSFYLKLPSGGHGLDGYQGPMWDAWQTGVIQWLKEIKIL